MQTEEKYFFLPVRWLFQLRIKRYVLAISLFCCISIVAQQSDLSKGVNYISEFIASDYFHSLKSKCTDLDLTDTLYLRALKYKDYDYSEALLILTFATIPYKTVPIILPVIKTTLLFPLVSDADSIFELKNKNLPEKLFFDTPPGNFGDKDKHAHFLGSAFLGFNSSFFDFGNLFGYFVEVFEEDFKVQSSIDDRDLMADRLGYIFGKLLKYNKNVLPSEMLIIRSLFYCRYHL